PEGVDERPQVVGEEVEVVGVFGRGMVAPAVAAQVGGGGVPAHGGQTVEDLGEVLLGAGEAVHQQEVTFAIPGLGHLDGDLAGRHGPDLHQPPPPPAMPFRSATWSAGGAFTCTGTPKSNTSRVNVSEPAAPGVDAATLDLLRSMV